MNVGLSLEISVFNPKMSVSIINTTQSNPKTESALQARIEAACHGAYSDEASSQVRFRFMLF